MLLGGERGHRDAASAPFEQDEPRYEFNRSIADMREIARKDAVAVHSHGDAIPLGLASRRLGYGYTITTEILRLPSGTYCASLRDVNVTLAYSNSAIYVAREIPYGSCVHDEVLAHERQHIEIDRQLMLDMRDDINTNLQRVVNSIGQIRAGSQSAAVDGLKRRIDSGLVNVYEIYAQERADRQQSFDSPEEYRRIGQVCGGAAAKYIRQYMNNR